MDAKKLQSLVDQYIRNTLLKDEVTRAKRKPLSPDKLSDQIRGLEDYESELRQALVDNDFTIIREDINNLIKRERLNFEEGKAQHIVFCRQILKAEIKAVNIAINREKGIYSDDDIDKWMPDHLAILDKIVTSQTNSVFPMKTKGRPGENWDLIKQHFREMVEDGSWTDFSDGWRTSVIKELLAWYKENHGFVSKTGIVKKATALKNLKDMFDEAEARHRST